MAKRAQQTFRHRHTESFLDSVVFPRTSNEEDVLTAVEVGWRGVSSRMAGHVHEDFLLKAGATLPLPWVVKDTSSAGTPTTDFVTDSDGGVYRLKLASTDEVEVLTLYFADTKPIDAAKDSYFECKVTYTNATPAATERVTIGLAGNWADDANTIGEHAWFLITGTGQQLFIESDDGTTDDDDNDSGAVWVSGTAIVLGIDYSNLAAIGFYVNGVLVGELSSPLQTGNLQPYIQLQKGDGTTVPQLDIDYVDVDWMR